ncbi:MAG: hypothetical protein ACJ8FU_15600 [Xanthobacteraceae bacterium]|jgi:hypothetical protein
MADGAPDTACRTVDVGCKTLLSRRYHTFRKQPEQNTGEPIPHAEIFAGLDKAGKFPADHGLAAVRMCNQEETAMLRKLMIAAALAGAAMLVLPGSATDVFAQAGTKGAGAPRTGTGPGTDRGNPSVTNDTGPGANPITPAPRKRTVKKHRRGTVGSR